VLNNIILQRLTRPFRTAWLPARVQSVAISIWVILVTSATLKWVVPYIHWYASAVLIAILALSLPRPRWADLRLPLVASAALTLAICTLVFVSRNPVYEVLEAGKLAIILLVLLPLLTTSPALALAALRGAEISIWINLALVLVGKIASGAFSRMMARSRIGTALNTPGTLWRLAILLLVLAGMRYLFGGGTFRNLLLFGTSFFLIVLDGSRTAFLLALIAPAIFTAVFVSTFRPLLQRLRPRILLTRVGAMALVVACVFLARGYFIRESLTSEVWRDLSSKMQRIATQAKSAPGKSTTAGAKQASAAPAPQISSRPAESTTPASSQPKSAIEPSVALKAADSLRADMLRVVIAAIKKHPIIGTGMGTTLAVTSHGPIVVHMAYLQLWADVGLLGFLSLSALNFGSVIILWRKYKTRAMSNPNHCAIFYNGVGLLICWAIADIFHPISTELSEWIMFLIGYCSVLASAPATTRPRLWHSRPAYVGELSSVSRTNESSLVRETSLGV